METDSIVAHGATAAVLMDRSRDSVAPMDADICGSCGQFVFEHQCWCGASPNRKTKVRTKRPYVVATQEFTGLGIRKSLRAA